MSCLPYSKKPLYKHTFTLDEAWKGELRCTVGIDLSWNYVPWLSVVIPVISTWSETPIDGSLCLWWMKMGNLNSTACFIVKSPLKPGLHGRKYKKKCFLWWNVWELLSETETAQIMDYQTQDNVCLRIWGERPLCMRHLSARPAHSSFSGNTALSSALWSGHATSITMCP